MPKPPHTVGGSSSPSGLQRGLVSSEGSEDGTLLSSRSVLGQPATREGEPLGRSAASCRCERLIFNSSQSFFSTVSPPPRHPQGKAASTRFWSSWCLAACLTVRDERGVSPASTGGCCPGAPPQQLLSQVSFQGWDTRGTPRAGAASGSVGSACITGSGARLPRAYFPKVFPFFSFKAASTSKGCFWSSWAPKMLDGRSTLPARARPTALP